MSAEHTVGQVHRLQCHEGLSDQSAAILLDLVISRCYSLPEPQVDFGGLGRPHRPVKNQLTKPFLREPAKLIIAKYACASDDLGNDRRGGQWRCENQKDQNGDRLSPTPLEGVGVGQRRCVTEIHCSQR